MSNICKPRTYISLPCHVLFYPHKICTAHFTYREEVILLQFGEHECRFVSDIFQQYTAQVEEGEVNSICILISLKDF